MNPPTLTPSEAALVRDLLKLWDALYGDAYHKYDCECKVCKAIEAAGNHNSATFASLAAKVGGDK